MAFRLGALAALGGLISDAIAADDSISARAYDVLRKNCFACHGPAKTSGLDLRSTSDLDPRRPHHGPHPGDGGVEYQLAFTFTPPCPSTISESITSSNNRTPKAKLARFPFLSKTPDR